MDNCMLKGWRNELWKGMKKLVSNTVHTKDNIFEDNENQGTTTVFQLVVAYCFVIASWH